MENRPTTLGKRNTLKNAFLLPVLQRFRPSCPGPPVGPRTCEKQTGFADFQEVKRWATFRHCLPLHPLAFTSARDWIGERRNDGKRREKVQGIRSRCDSSLRRFAVKRKEKGCGVLTREINVPVRCRFCHAVEVLTGEDEAFRQFQSGEGRIQDLFPDMTPAQREILKSGTCSRCWDEMIRGASKEE